MDRPRRHLDDRNQLAILRRVITPSVCLRYVSADPQLVLDGSCRSSAHIALWCSGHGYRSDNHRMVDLYRSSHHTESRCVPYRSASVGQSKLILVVICVVIYNAAFGMSWGPVPWLYPPEIMPLPFRAKGVSLSTATVGREAGVADGRIGFS